MNRLWVHSLGVFAWWVAWAAGTASVRAQERRAPPARLLSSGEGGRLERINGFLVLHVSGTPEEMGEQHGRLLRNEVRRMITDVVIEGEGKYGYERLIRGAAVMHKFLPKSFRRELRALAGAAGVKYSDLVAAQLFGDVWRGMYCTSYAVFGPATRDGRCIVGRNMDYWDHGVMVYGAVLIHFSPSEGNPFFTVSWAGIINGWTAMNDKGIVVANNSGYGGKNNSLEGLSTCFMLRKIVQFAETVAEGVRIVRTTPRAVGTNMIIAGGRPAAGAIVEYDHDEVTTRWAEDGVILAANSFRTLYQETDVQPAVSGSSRYQILAKLIGDNYGRIDRSMNFAGAPGVPIESMNLHSALLFPDRLRFRIAMGSIPAYRRPYRRFRLTPAGIVADAPSSD